MSLTLYRYGRRRFVRELAATGRFRLSPASDFARLGLPPGTRDSSELEIEHTLPSTARMFVVDRSTGLDKEELRFREPPQAKVTSETDYLIFCMSYRYEERLYADFDADTCLVITDPDRFIDQIGKAARAALPGWAIDAGTTRYRSSQAFHGFDLTYQDIYYNKSIDYEHQAEVRLVCSPPQHAKKLSAIFVEAGSVAEYCSVTGVERPDLCLPAIDWLHAWGSPFGDRPGDRR